MQEDNYNQHPVAGRWVDRGFPHHVCVVSGCHKERLVQFARAHNVNVLS